MQARVCLVIRCLPLIRPLRRIRRNQRMPFGQVFRGLVENSGEVGEIHKKLPLDLPGFWKREAPPTITTEDNQLARKPRAFAQKLLERND